MADSTKTVEILLKGKDLASDAIKGVTSGLENIESAAKPFAKLADIILDVDKALAVLAAGGLAYSAYKFSEFETSTTSLTKILATELKPQAGEVTSAMIEMSNEFGLSSSVLLDTATSWKRAGFDLSELNKLTKDSVVLFTAAAESEFELGTATETLVRIIKGFNTGAEDSARITDVLNKLANEYATSVSMLGEGMARLAPNANIMGLSIEELGGILVPAIEVFQSGEIASTALNTSFLKLIDPSSKVQNALAGIGVYQRDANGAMKSGKEVLYEVAEAFKTVEENEKLQVATQLVGIRQATKFITVIDRWDYAMKAVEVATKAGGSALEELTARMEDSRKQAERVVAAFNNLAIMIGGKYAEASKGILSGFAEVEIAMQKVISDGTFDPIFDRINDFGIDLGNAFDTIAEELPGAFANVDFSELLKEFDEITGGVQGFFANLDLTSPEGLTEALQFLTDSFTSLLRVTSGMFKQFEPFYQAILEGIKQVNDLDKETAESFGRILGSAKLIVDAGAKIAAAFFLIQQSGTDIQNVFNVIVGSAKALWNGVQYTFDEMTILLLESIQKVIEFAGTLTKLPGIPDSWKKSVKDAGDEVDSFLAGVKLDQAKQLEEAMEGASQAMDGFTGNTREAKKALDDITDKEIEIPIKTKGDILNEILDVQNKIDNLQKLKVDLQFAIEGASKEDVEKINQAIKEVDGSLIELMGKENKLEIDLDPETVKKTEQRISEIVKGKNVVVKAKAETEEAKKTVEQLFVDVGGKTMVLEVAADKGSIEKTKETLEKEIPADKVLELRVELEMAGIEAATARFESLQETAQVGIEWKAKLDIAEVEANAQIVTTQIEALGGAFESAGSIISESLGILGGLDFGSAGALDVFRVITEQIKTQNELQKESLEIQRDIAESQIELNKAKAKRLDGGKGIEITLNNVDQMNVYAQMFFYEIMGDLQTRINEEGGDVLLGL